MAVSVDSMFEYSDEEIYVVSVDPNDEKLINFDLLTWKLSSDYDEESDYHTDTDSDTEDVMIDVVNTSIVPAEINNNENNFSTLQDKSTSMDSKVLKRKRQNSDDSAMKTSKRKKIIEDQSNNLWNYFDKSMSEPSKAATPQKQRTLSTSTKICPNKSPKSETTRLECVVLTCTKCNLQIKETEKNSKKCPKCRSNFAFSCNYCDSKFTFKSNLLSHIRYKHTNTEPVDCPTCNRLYKNQDSLRHHMRICNVPQLECCFCSFATKKTKEINFHLQTEHMEQLDAIEDLTHAYRKVFKNEILQDYMSSQSSSYCSQCGKIVEAIGPWNKREYRMCKSITLLQCNKCGQQYNKYQSLYYHLKKICYPREILSCDHCAYTTSIKSELRNHMVDKHVFIQNDKLKYIVLSCTKCEKRTRTLDEKSDKCSKCMTNFTFSSEKCSKQLPGLREALDHQNNKCELMCYYCDHCDSKFNYKYSLVRHLHSVHTKAEPVECPTCHGIFKHLNTLKVHVRTCSKPPHLLCCFCPYASKQIVNIKCHLKIEHMEQIGTVEEFENVCRKIIRNGEATLGMGKENRR